MLPKHLQIGLPQNNKEWIALVRLTREKKPDYVIDGRTLEYIDSIKRGMTVQIKRIQFTDVMGNNLVKIATPEIAVVKTV